MCDTIILNITMSRYLRVKQEDKIPWKFNEVNVLLRKVKEDSTLETLTRIHRRSPESIKAKLNTLAADYYFTNQDIFKQIQNITGISEKEFLVRREFPELIQSQNSPDISGSPKVTNPVNTESQCETDIQMAIEDSKNGVCVDIAVSILDKIIGGTTLLKSTIKTLSTINSV